MPRPYNRGADVVVEVLYFDGCPHYRDAVTLVERLIAETSADADVRLVEVRTRAEAETLRFLGSPTVRVGGCDIEPGADVRTDYVLACRIYATVRGLSGLPAESWIRNALLS